MKNILTILVAFVCLSSCHHKRQPQAEVEEITQEFIDSIIFHGYTTHVASIRLKEDGSGSEWSEFEPYVVKYALYLAHGIVAVFSDSAQFHAIEEYLGKEVIGNYTSYNLEVSAQKAQGGKGICVCSKGDYILLFKKMERGRRTTDFKFVCVS